MSKTLAELRAQKPSSLPTRIVTVYLNLDVLAQVQRLEQEKKDIRVELGRRPKADDDDGPEKPKRAGEGPPPRLAEIDAELEVCYDTMRADEGELLLRATTGGKWLRWLDEHPAREGNQSDEVLAFGICNASDLADDLGRYVVAWNGEPLTPEDWSSWLADQIAPADIGGIVQQVTDMHTTRVSAPKAQGGSSATSPQETA